MTENKRFKLFVGENYGVQGVDGEVIFDSIRSIADADVLVEFLNDLSNEIELLKKENEQLKQFKKQVCNLIDTKIKHYEHKPISAPVSQPMSVNFDYDVDRLARLSELQDLKKELKE